MLVPIKQALGNRDKKHIVMKIYPISDGIYFTDRTSDLYSYILCLIGQALWNRDRIYIVTDICPISEEIEYTDRTSDLYSSIVSDRTSTLE